MYRHSALAAATCFTSGGLYFNPNNDIHWTICLLCLKLTSVYCWIKYDLCNGFGKPCKQCNGPEHCFQCLGVQNSRLQMGIEHRSTAAECMFKPSAALDLHGFSHYLLMPSASHTGAKGFLDELIDFWYFHILMAKNVSVCELLYNNTSKISCGFMISWILKLFLHHSDILTAVCQRTVTAGNCRFYTLISLTQ